MAQGFPSLLATDANAFSYGPKGEMAPESALKEQALIRRRQIANLLIQKGLAGGPGGKMIGRFYVADSPVQGAAGLAQVLAGGLGNMALDKEQKGIASADQQMVADAVKAYRDKMNGPSAEVMPPQPQPDAPPQGGASPAAQEQGPYNGQVGGIPQPDVGVQSSSPPIPATPPPLINAASGMQVQGIAPETIPGDMSQFAQAPPAQEAIPTPPPVAPPPVPRKPAFDDLAELLTHQHPQVRAYGQLMAAMQQKQIEAARDQSNKDRAFGLDEQGLKNRADETRALRESTDAYRQAQLGAQLTGMGITAENNRQMRDIQQQNADRSASHDKVLEKLGLMDAETKRMQLNQGKIPPGYRATRDGGLEAIPGGPADTKLQGVLNQDTAIMNSSTAGLDRLASSANQILNHPGLAGVTGIRGKIPDIPGTNAADARALLEKLKSQVAFDVLQDMRNNSKTGGALGNVSDAEGKRLENNLAALNSAQSIDQFKKELQSVIEFTNGAKDRLRDAFNMKHKGVIGEPVTSKPSPSGALSADEQKELDTLRKKYGR